MDAKLKAEMGDDLHAACIEGDLPAVEAAISKSKATNPSYNPPFPSIMYTAASKDHVEIVQYCLQNSTPITPDVMKIIMINRSLATYTHLLTTKSISPNYYIPWFGDMLTNAANGNDIPWAQLCLTHGADPNYNLVDEHMSILASAAEVSSLEMATLLISHGARVQGSGAITMAAEAGKLDMVKFLLENGAEIDEIGIEHPTDPRYREDMRSALHKAVVGVHEGVVGFLLERGADVNLRDVMGRTALGLAGGKGEGRIGEMLRGKGAVQ